MTHNQTQIKAQADWLLEKANVIGYGEIDLKVVVHNGKITRYSRGIQKSVSVKGGA